MNFFSTIKSAVTSYIGDEADGDTEDDTHVCRVLRTYYAEKSRPLPPWLPPDPKAPVVQPQYVNPASARAGGGYGGYGNFGGQQQGGPVPGRAPSSGSQRGVLSDLWDSPARSSAPAQEENMSMRRGGGSARPSALSRHAGGGYHNRNQSGSQDSGYGDDSSRRPLPSQRAGSFQTQKTTSIREDDYRSSAPSSSSLSNWSAQDRLKAKLAGGRSASPVQSVQSSNSSQSRLDDYGGGGGGGWSSSRGQASQQQSRGGYEAGPNRYDGGGGGAPARNPYEQQQPYVSATAPWSSGDDLYGPGGAGQSNGSWGSGANSGGRRGAPNGPRQYR